MGKLGDAVVEVGADLKGLDSGLAQAERHLKGWVGTAGGLLAGLGVTAGLAGAGAALVDSAKKAADLGETLSKTKNTFGTDSRLIIDYADRMAEKFGLVRTETIDAATGIGLIGKAAGMADGASARLGVDMAKIAADLSSFHNVPMVDALAAIRSGLVGESEPLRRFGILLNEDAVKAEALRLGLVRAGKELTEQAKVQARVSLITNAPALSPVNGDLERTADSAANQMRKFWGDLENAKAKFGEALLGPMSEALKLATELGTAIGAIGKDGAGPAGEWAKSWIGAIRLVMGTWDPELFKLGQKGGIQAIADKQAGVQKGGKIDANGNQWDTSEAGTPGGDAKEANLGKQIRERREAAEKAAAAEKARAQAERQRQLSRLSDWELRGQGLARDKTGVISPLDVSGKAMYEERRRQSEADYRAGKPGGMLPSVFDATERKKFDKETRRDDMKGGIRGLGQLARGFAEKAVDAVKAAPGLASADRGTAMAARAQLGAAGGLLGPFGGPGARLLAGAGAAIGAASRQVTEQKEQRARMGPSQVMSSDQYASMNLAGAFNNERDKQLAAQEKANDKLAEINDGIRSLVQKAGERAGAILRGRS